MKSAVESMSAKESFRRLPAQRIKLLLSVTLAAVLLAVLFLDDRTADSPMSSAPARPRVSSGPSSTTPSATAVPRPAVPDRLENPLPEVDIERILAQNPFHGGHWSTEIDRLGEGSESTIASNSFDEQQSGDRSGQDRASQPSGKTSLQDATSSADTLAVRAIVMGAGRPAALIGDRLYHEEEVIDKRWRIVTINAHGVVIQSTASLDALHQ